MLTKRFVYYGGVRSRLLTAYRYLVPVQYMCNMKMWLTKRIACLHDATWALGYCSTQATVVNSLCHVSTQCPTFAIWHNVIWTNRSSMKRHYLPTAGRKTPRPMTHFCATGSPSVWAPSVIILNRNQICVVCDVGRSLPGSAAGSLSSWLETHNGHHAVPTSSLAWWWTVS